MILRYHHLHRFPTVFRSLTGLRVNEFDQLVDDVLPAFAAAREARLFRPDRQRAAGAGDRPALDARDQILLTVVWLRTYPTNEVLGFLFGVSDSTASRLLARLVPLLAAAGRDTMRMPDPGRKHRRELGDLLREVPELAVVIDSFEQRVQRPKQPLRPVPETDEPEANKWYSGKKKQHTIKSQVAVNLHTGEVADIAPSVRGPVNDQQLLKQSGLLLRLPEGVGAMGDLGYYGMKEAGDRLHTPRRKPRGQPRPPEDIEYNRAFAAARVQVENTINRLRRYQSLTQLDRHHRRGHTERVCAVSGLVNRQLRHRQPGLVA